MKTRLTDRQRLVLENIRARRNPGHGTTGIGWLHGAICSLIRRGLVEVALTDDGSVEKLTKAGWDALEVRS